MDQDSTEDPKLIIDEDWKTQVQREKEELKRKSEQQADSGVEEKPAADSSSSEAASSSDEHTQALPPASLPLLVTSLATQALASMGQIPGEDGKAPPINLTYARHFIDLIGVLEEKTQGNVSDEEKEMLQETLHQLRMLFVNVTQNSNG